MIRMQMFLGQLQELHEKQFLITFRSFSFCSGRKTDTHTAHMKSSGQYAAGKHTLHSRERSQTNMQNPQTLQHSKDILDIHYRRISSHSPSCRKITRRSATTLVTRRTRTASKTCCLEDSFKSEDDNVFAVSWWTSWEVIQPRRAKANKQMKPDPDAIYVIAIKQAQDMSFEFYW